jgi:hypothetical protein
MWLKNLLRWKSWLVKKKKCFLPLKQREEINNFYQDDVESIMVKEVRHRIWKWILALKKYRKLMTHFVLFWNEKMKNGFGHVARMFRCLQLAIVCESECSGHVVDSW